MIEMKTLLQDIFQTQCVFAIRTSVNILKIPSEPCYLGPDCNGNSRLQCIACGLVCHSSCKVFIISILCKTLSVISNMKFEMTVSIVSNS